MTKNDILDELSKNKSYIEENFEVEKIGLFGSYTKGKQTEDSDIDIYVEFKHKTFHKHKNNNIVIILNIQKEVIYG